ncbi:MAG: WecB/TagA/CpsF family glycosyltransferase [bacterium]
MNHINLAGLEIDNVTLKEATNKVEVFIASGQPHLLVTPNPEIIVSSQEDEELKEIINSADLRIPDGISMVVVSKLLGTPLKERVSGIDLMLEIIKLSARKGYKIFLLGSAPGIAASAAQKLVTKHPNLKIVGTLDGYFKEDENIICKIKAVKPDILFVGLGGGRQEKWLHRNLDELNIRVGMVIGGSLDVISGQKKRAPVIFQKLYIEWLYRLITEPGRWKRQLALPKFLYLTLIRPFL